MKIKKSQEEIKVIKAGRSIYLAKNIGILTISNFASKILVFLLVPLYTHILSTAEYGTYDIVYSTIQLLFPILTLNISDAMMRFSIDKNRNINEIALIGIRTFILGIIPGVLFLLIVWHWALIKPIEGYELYILAYFVFYSSFQFLIQFAKGMEHVKDMGIAGILSTVFLLGGNLIFLLATKWGLKGFYIANVIGQIVPSLYLAIRLRIWKYPLKGTVNRTLKHEMFQYCIPLIVSVLGWWVNNTADKYTVAIICGASSNGLLSVAYKIPSIINVVQSIFIQAWQISAIREYESNDKAVFYGKYFCVLNVVMAAVCSWLILLTKPIGYIMYARDFYAAWRFVPFLLLACVLNSAAGFLGPILSAQKASKSMAISAVYGAGTNIVLNIVFVHLIGIQGSTIATVISSLVIYIVRSEAVGSEIEIEKHGTVLITWILLCIQAVLEVYTPFWLLEIIIMGIMLILNIEKIKEILKVFKHLMMQRINN